MSTIQPNDAFMINREGKDYKATVNQFAKDINIHVECGGSGSEIALDGVLTFKGIVGDESELPEPNLADVGWLYVTDEGVYWVLDETHNWRQAGGTTDIDLSGYATVDHEHSEYATVEHEHSDYAAVDHDHSEYAAVDHEHSEYAAVDHDHSEYATVDHDHSEYATVEHEHSDYMPLDISSLPLLG